MPAGPPPERKNGTGSIPVINHKYLLYIACIVQAVFSGLIAGRMGESALAAGVKHSCGLLIITMAAFNVVIMV